MDDAALRSRLKDFLAGENDCIGVWFEAKVAQLRLRPGLNLHEKLCEVRRTMSPAERAMLEQGPSQIEKLLDPDLRLLPRTGQQSNNSPLIHAAICLDYRAAFDLIMEVILTPEQRQGLFELRDGSGDTPLFLAVCNADIIGDYYVERLLDYGAHARASIQFNDESGTAHCMHMGLLHFAPTPGTVRLLLSHGVDINAQEPLLGRTPLHVAIRENKPNVVYALLEARASTRIRDRDGETPLDYAQRNSDMVDLFKQYFPQEIRLMPSLAVRELMGSYNPDCMQDIIDVDSLVFSDSSDSL